MLDATGFGRYEPLFRLGLGGMAEVFVARMRGEGGFERLVALKRMLPHLVEDSRFVDMFLDEARIAANVQSPHVVATLDLGRATNGELYLVMELVLGVSLGYLLKVAHEGGHTLPIDVAADVVAQAARGLHDAHEARTPLGRPLGIVHRDVAPKNILVGYDGRVRVSDFGVARALARLSVTAPGQMKGTWSYASPEQATGQPIDPRSDVFSLGVVAWECFAGRRLFTGNDPLSLVQQVKNGAMPTLRSVRPDVPAAIDAVVMRALCRDPAQRFRSALEMAVELSRAARVGDADLARRRTAEHVAQLAGERIEGLRSRIERHVAGQGGDTAAALAMPSEHPRAPEAARPPTVQTEIPSMGTPSMPTETLAPDEAAPPVRSKPGPPLDVALHDAPTELVATPPAPRARRIPGAAWLGVAALAVVAATIVATIVVNAAPASEPPAAPPRTIVVPPPRHGQVVLEAHDLPPDIQAELPEAPIAQPEEPVAAPVEIEEPRPRIRRVATGARDQREAVQREEARARGQLRSGDNPLMGIDDFDRETGRAH